MNTYEGRGRLLAALLCAGSFTTVETFMLLATLESVRSGLKASEAELQLVLASFWVANAASLILGGRLGESIGRLRALRTGLAWTAVCGIGAALSSSVWWLIGMRSAMGLGAALCVPQILALMRVTFEGQEGRRAFELYGMVLGMAAVISVLLGGALMATMNETGYAWRIGCLAGAVTCIAALLISPVTKEEGKRWKKDLDWLGGAMLMAGLGMVCSALTLGRQQGWPGWSWWAMAMGPAVVVAVTRRGGSEGSNESGLLPRRLMRNKGFARGAVAIALFYSGVASYYLMLSLELSNQEATKGVNSSIVFMSMAACIALGSGSRRLGRLIGKHWARWGAWVLCMGHLVMAVAATGLNEAAVVWGIWIAACIQGLGIGILMGRLAGEVIGRVVADDSSVGSGVTATAQQMGNAIGVCVLGVVYLGAAGGTWWAALYLAATVGAARLLLGKTVMG